jgi:hypothetical protein
VRLPDLPAGLVEALAATAEEKMSIYRIWMQIVAMHILYCLWLEVKMNF